MHYYLCLFIFSWVWPNRGSSRSKGKRRVRLDISVHTPDGLSISLMFLLFITLGWMLGS